MLTSLAASVAWPKTFSGSVVEDHTGRALASAEIQVQHIGSVEILADIESDSEGRFQLPDLESGEYRIEVSKPNYVTVAMQLHVADGAGNSIVVRLVRRGVITGHVVDQQGQPLQNATVLALPAPAGGGPVRKPMNFQQGLMVHVDERGGFRLKQPGFTVALASADQSAFAAAATKAEPDGSLCTIGRKLAAGPSNS